MKPAPSVIQKEHEKRHFLRSCQALGLFGMLAFALGQADQVSSDSGTAPATDDPLSRVSLCDWQRDYDFFTGAKKTEKAEPSVPCEEAFSKRIAPESPPVVGVSTAPGSTGERALFEAELRAIVAGYPIETMVPTIAEYDREIAGLIVGIGKKESNWGKRVPRTDTGEDCFNYWGYKGAGARGVAMGHGCFGEPAEAVHAIGNRLQELVALRKTSEPANMTIWKCGSSCATHSPESVRKWISDVDLYYREIAQK
jgi:hypothetical protein